MFLLLIWYLRGTTTVSHQYLTIPMQLALWILPHMTLKLDSEVVHTHPVVLWKCTSIISGGLCAIMSFYLTHMLLTLHAASLDTPTLLTQMLWLTREFFSVLELYVAVCCCMSLDCNQLLAHIFNPVMLTLYRPMMPIRIMGTFGVFFDRSGLLVTIYAMNRIHCTHWKLNVQ